MRQLLPAYKYVILGVEGGSHNEMPTCEMPKYGYEGWLNISAISRTYLDATNQKNRPIDCMWIVNVTEGWKVREGVLSWHYLFHCNLVYMY
jgi:hypothetical protein